MPSSLAFDPICYLSRYPDLRTGYMFWSASGKWQYGNPSNRKLKKLSDDPLWHYQNFGIAEGRVPGCDLPGTNYSNEFNATAYMARYYDIRVGSYYPWNQNPLLHYTKEGIYEGRHPGFEILTPRSGSGVVSPGTTTYVADPTPPHHEGDGEVINIDPMSDIDIGQDEVGPLVDPPDPGDNTGDISTWISANPWLVAGVVGAGLLLLHKSKNHKRSKSFI